MITVPAGSSLILRCPGTQEIVLVTLAESRAPFIADLPPIPVLSLDGPGVRRFGILELVTSSGVTWVEAELRDDVLRVLNDAPTDVVQRRSAPRKAGPYPATGTVQVEKAGARTLVAISGRVEDISAKGLLLRATADERPSLPSGIERTLLHIAMPWGDLTAAVTTVDQRADLLRGTFEWVDPAGADELRQFCRP
ncbi:PilZ domain-containing protein [Actinoplanes sp. NPDC024001]|uniref:PilZ domain-containing protein n=1 Tax=Actinoplanes sp. NPDC024001 TaxID=3154598 RepID=UPI0034000794